MGIEFSFWINLPTHSHSYEAEYLIQTKGINNGSEHQRLLFYVRVLLFFLSVFSACKKTRNPHITLPEHKTVALWPFYQQAPRTDCVVLKCVANREM